MPYDFSVNFDYRCPFARNAHEHVVTALKDGARYNVRFVGFSLDQAHVADGGKAVWDDQAQRRNLVPVAAGIVVRDRQPERFLDAHISLFAARHDDNGDLRDEAVVRHALARADVDPGFVFAELDSGWPFAVYRREHEESVTRYGAFGVPTFISGAQAVFVRFMHRPDGDGALARATVDRALDLLTGHPELNEFKHTTVPH